MHRFALSIVIITTILFAGCTPTPDTNPTADFDTDFTPSVSVTGKLLPAVWSHVSAQRGGIITNLLVKEGDTVSTGDPLVQ
jgi:multidrug efflux pump subunit AcrA (membrane-fusion protein)